MSPTCWTCGSPVDQFRYDCPQCPPAAALAELKHHATQAEQGLDRLALVQVHGFQQLQATLTRGFSQLATAMEWGFADVSWRLQQQTDILRSIDQTLSTPSETQADEYRVMADTLKERGVLGEAEEFYRKALALNRLDYRTYVGLAETLLRTGAYQQALEVLDKSMPHAPTNPRKRARIADWRSLSLRLSGHVHACLGDYPVAAAALVQAVTLSPKYAEAHYDHAQYAGWTRDAAACVKSLDTAITLEPLYWYLAQRQRAFHGVQEGVKSLLLTHRDAAADELEATRSECRRAFLPVQLVVSEMTTSVSRGWRGWLVSLPHHRQVQALEAAVRRVEDRLTELQRVIDAKDYRGLLDGNEVADELREEIGGLKEQANQLRPAVQQAVLIGLAALTGILGLLIFIVVALCSLR